PQFPSPHIGQQTGSQLAGTLRSSGVTCKVCELKNVCHLTHLAGALCENRKRGGAERRRLSKMSIAILPNDDKARLARSGQTGPDTPITLKDACQHHFS